MKIKSNQLIVLVLCLSLFFSFSSISLAESIDSNHEYTKEELIVAEKYMHLDEASGKIIFDEKLAKQSGEDLALIKQVSDMLHSVNKHVESNEISITRDFGLKQKSLAKKPNSLNKMDTMLRYLEPDHVEGCRGGINKASSWWWGWTYWKCDCQTRWTVQRFRTFIDNGETVAIMLAVLGPEAVAVGAAVGLSMQILKPLVNNVENHNVGYGVKIEMTRLGIFAVSGQ